MHWGKLRPKNKTVPICSFLVSSCTKGLDTSGIRDLDRRKVGWKKFHEINIVDHNDKTFEASNGPDEPSSLLGAVKLIPMGSE
jgi:hypothetical protein